jgi:hypothetical protein
MRKVEMLMELYKTLWISADFENDFQGDWRTIYNIMFDGDTVKRLPEPIVKCCYNYLQEWIEKNPDLISQNK